MHDGGYVLRKMRGQLGPHRNPPAGTGVLTEDDRDAPTSGEIAPPHRKRLTARPSRHVPRSAYGVMRCPFDNAVTKLHVA
ncbi:hypothetical protein GCM10017688_52980 [Streptomyces ramulosus]